jgi:hypothetical protein
MSSHSVEFCAAQLIYVATGKADTERGTGNMIRATQASNEPGQPRSAVQDGKFPALIL